MLTLPKEEALPVAESLRAVGVNGFWNFTGKGINLEGAIVENVHLGDSLMTLCYRLCSENEKENDRKDETT